MGRSAEKPNGIVEQDVDITEAPKKSKKSKSKREVLPSPDGSTSADSPSHHESDHSAEIEKVKTPKTTKEGEAAGQEAMEIKKFRVSKESRDALKAKGIKTFFPIQAKTFDPIFDGKHVIGRARTGTGKTLAFALPVVENILVNSKLLAAYNKSSCRVLVLLPTRELAQQVASEFEALQCGRFKTVSVVGGCPEDPQLRAIRSGADVIVGTPGRTLDFLGRGLLELKNLRCIILDEADQMLEMGFREDVDAILDGVQQQLGSVTTSVKSESPKLQYLLFTATLPSWIHSISNKYMSSGQKVVIDIVQGQANQTAAKIKHLAILCGFHQRPKVLGDVLTLYAGLRGRCIVFTETKAQANDIGMSSVISHMCQVIHGDIPQKQREVTLKAFKDGRFRCLVATDVAARGLHIDDIELVVQLQPPKDVDTYIHRAGRTGRAGCSGTNIIFFGMADIPFLATIEKNTNQKFTRVAVPQPEDLMRATGMSVAETMKAMIEPEGGKKNAVMAERLLKFSEAAQMMISELGAVEAVSRCLCELSGYGKQVKSSGTDGAVISALTGREGFKTYEMTFKNTTIATKAYAWKALKNTLRGAEATVDRICSMIMRADNTGVVFDVPPEILEEFEKKLKEISKTSGGDDDTYVLQPLTQLPELSDPRFEEGREAAGYNGGRNPNSGSWRGAGGGGKRQRDGGGGYGQRKQARVGGFFSR